MLRKTALIATLALFGLTGSLHAEEHYVLMLGHGFFPDSAHPVIGDTIRFVNVTQIPMAATALDGSWTTGLLRENDAFVLPVIEGMTANYDNTLPELGGLLDAAAATALVSETVAASGIIDYLHPASVGLDANGKPVTLPDEVYDNR